MILVDKQGVTIKPGKQILEEAKQKESEGMKLEETTTKYDELWGRVRALDNSRTRELLCYLMGFCKHDEHFLAGVATGLPIYEQEQRLAKGGN